MKTPDEIKKGLEQCYKYKACGEECPYYTPGDMDCVDRMLADALSLIRQLESELEAVKRERDALLNHPSIRNCDHCEYCNDMDEFWAYREPCASCCEFSKFKLIQLCPENTEVQGDAQ